MAGKMIASDALTTKQLALLAALCDQPSIVKAAKVAGIAERTAYRWLDDPAFNAEYRRRRRRIVEHAQSMLQRACGQAVLTLVRNLGGADTPAAAQISAAKAILEQAIKAVELDDIEQRLMELEEALAPQLRPGATLHSVPNRGA